MRRCNAAAYDPCSVFNPCNEQYMDMMNEVLLWLVTMDVFERFVVLVQVI